MTMTNATTAAADADGAVGFTLNSRNGKTGPLPVSTSSRVTCPPSCPFMGNGCYADGYPLRGHWDLVTNGQRGWGFDGFLRQVAALPEGQVWRHNQAGDLPGVGDRLDARKARRLTRANKGRRGFTFTHKPLTRAAERAAVAHANANGFTINLSANTLAHADELAALAIGPVVVVLPATIAGKQTLTTPAGRRVVVCPATYRDDVTCASCKLCAVPTRSVVMGFPAHGIGTKKASAIAAA